MRVLIAGHWQTHSASDLYQRMRSAGRAWDGVACDGQPGVDVDGSAGPSTAQAHEALRGGIVDYLPSAHVETMIFGGGEDFPAALGCGEVPAPGRLVGVSIPRDCVDATSIGRQVSALIAQGCLVAIEGGHNGEVSLWASFIEGALGLSAGTLLTSDDGVVVVDEAALASSVDRLRNLWAGAIPTMVTSTQRPLVGLMSVMAVAPDLSTRSDTSTAQALALRRVLSHSRESHFPSLPFADRTTTDPASMPGAGAGGGIGAIISALGGSIRECGHFLESQGPLRQTLTRTDLLVVTEPTLHSPHLAEACVDTLTGAAADYSLPVVAVGIESSLSRHELAQWGIHGSLLAANTPEALHYVGQRLAHTWLRRR